MVEWTSGTRVMGASSARAPGSRCTGHGMSRWCGVWWMPCATHCSDHRVSQGYKRELRASGLAVVGSGNSCVLEFSC
jgi:hypothetical protein